MPAALEYRLNDRAQRQTAYDELQQRRAQIETAWRYYRGQHRRQLVVEKGEPDDNVVVNTPRQAVDRMVSFLAPKMPGIELDEARDTETERWLRGAWQQAGGAKLLARLAKYGAMSGQVFARVMPGTLYPRILALDPANVIVTWPADDHEQTLWYELQWTVGRENLRQDIINEGNSWRILEWVKASETTEWRATRNADWPWALGPVMDWQHISAPTRYGDAELDASAIMLTDQANKVASDISKILRFHASPRTVGIGFTAEKVTATGIDHFWTVPNPDAKVFNLEMQSDLQASMSMLEFLTGAFMKDRRVVILKGDVADFQRVTNLGMRALFVDMLAKNEELRRNYEQGIIDISRRVLMMGGMEYEGEIKVNWPDPLPVDPTESVGVLERERNLGIVSQETMARRQGYDWRLEQARMADETDSLVRALEQGMGADA